MIFDGDVHLSPTGERGMKALDDEILANLDEAGVDKALVWLIPPYLRVLGDSNRYVFESVKKYPQRFYGMGWANPRLGLDKAKQEVKQCMQEYGFYGVKLNGAQDEYPIDNRALTYPVIEEIAKLGGYLAFHIGSDAFANTHPYQVEKVARDFPELKILCAHMGGVGKPDLAGPMIEAAQRCSNLYLIGSAVSYSHILNAIKVLGSKRVLYGSDTPFDITRCCVAAYDALLDGYVTPQEKQDVMWGNLAHLFHVE